MFFYIGDKPPFQALEKVDSNLYLDKGWSNINSIWYKGYSTDCVLSSNLKKILEGYKPAGKWCVISDDKVYHPELRGFPLWQADGYITNINIESYNVIPNILTPPIEESLITLDAASVIIGNILLENTQNFFKYNEIGKINVLFSGGLDTLTSWAVLDSVRKDYCLDGYIPKLRDKDISLYAWMGRVRDYSSDLMDYVSDNHWGYNISSFYKEKNWYLTGYYAETIQFRDAMAIHALANYKGKMIDELAEPNDYLYWFLKRPSLDKFKKNMLNFDNDQSLKAYLYNTIFGDYQMWHFDNNMTFSPFADIRITNTMMRLSIEDITNNAMNGLIQKKIVERFNPQLLSILSDFKNEKNVFANFRKNFSKIKLDPNVKINIR